MQNKYDLPYRKGVGIILLNKEKKIFVGKRIDNPGNFWQMPQGGLNLNESYRNAAIRELKEETSIKNIKIIKEIDDYFTYDLPNHLIGKIWKGKYKGQKQKWFIMNFIGKDSEIKLETNNAEFLKWKWVDPKELTRLVVKFKINIYKKIYEELKKKDLI